MLLCKSSMARSNLSRSSPPSTSRQVWPLRAISAALLLTCAIFTSAQSLTVGTADPVRYLNDIKALTPPAMEGRGDDTKGIALATAMLEERYKSLGLLPAGTQGFR